MYQRHKYALLPSAESAEAHLAVSSSLQVDWLLILLIFFSPCDCILVSISVNNFCCRHTYFILFLYCRSVYLSLSLILPLSPHTLSLTILEPAIWHWSLILYKHNFISCHVWEIYSYWFQVFYLVIGLNTYHYITLRHHKCLLLVTSIIIILCLCCFCFPLLFLLSVPNIPVSSWN